jgi:ABC-type sugar transport system ATPase subunit
MKNGRMVGTVKKTEVTTDEVLGMIIGGTKPAHATVTDSYEQTVAAAAASATAAA